MKTPLVVAVVLLFGAGLLVGRLTAPRSVVVAPGAEDPHAALDDLMRYRGQGSRAERYLPPLVDAIVAGGEAMVPDLESALASGKDRDYHLVPDMDTDQYVLARYATRRLALLEAVSRIGGDRAVEILLVAAKGGRNSIRERTAAVLFLARHADRAAVREFFNRRLHEFLVVRKNDREMLLFLRITRPYIYESAFDEIADAFAAGWAGAVDPSSVYSELGGTLAALDEARAGDVFTRILEDPTAIPNARAASATCLARIPSARPRALEFLLRDENQVYLVPFVKGMKWGRFGEAYLNRNADESQDAKVRIVFLEKWIELQRQVAQLLDEIAARVRPEVRAAVEVDANREYLKAQIAAAEARLAAEKRAAGD